MSYNELRNTLWANGMGKKKFVWRRLVLACHGIHKGTKSNLGFEAWKTFQMTYNELRNTIWANGTGEKKIVQHLLVLACHGTYLGMQ
jgi:hypothetical protein